LEEPYVEECIEVMPHDLELLDLVFIECPLNSIPQSSLFHSSVDPSIPTSLEFETCRIYAPNLDQTQELNVTIGLEDSVEDLGFMPNLCVQVFYKTSRPLSSK